jgi:hypothetical protein
MPIPLILFHYSNNDINFYIWVFAAEFVDMKNWCYSAYLAEQFFFYQTEHLPTWLNCSTCNSEIIKQLKILT